MIDGGLLDDWSEAVVQATARFDQGDLVERPPFFYAGRPSHGVWQTTRSLDSDLEDDESLVIELAEEDCPPYGLLTTQGCDIADTSRKPWVQVAPVYPVTDLSNGDARLPGIRRDSVPHFVLLDPPGLDGEWVVDLRIEVPVEKSWLAGKEPIAAFADERDRRRLAERLAGRLRRPALPDEVHEIIVRPLRNLLDRANTQLREDLSSAGIELRLALRSHPDSTHECRLLVVARRGEVPESVRTAVESWWADLPREDLRVTVLGCVYATTDEVSMREYLASELLDGRFVGEDAA